MACFMNQSNISSFVRSCLLGCFYEHSSSISSNRSYQDYLQIVLFNKLRLWFICQTRYKKGIPPTFLLQQSFSYIFRSMKFYPKVKSGKNFFQQKVFCRFYFCNLFWQQIYVSKKLKTVPCCQWEAPTCLQSNLEATNEMA